MGERKMSENKYLDFIKNNDNLEEALIEGADTDLFMQFSNMRKNILDWYEFSKDDEVLEIGAGCGIITSMLCQRCNNVIALESSEDYCDANRYLNRAYNNLQVICGNVDLLEVEKKFDIITVIGGFRKNQIQEIKKHLKQNGKLIVAIDNRYGLKYFNGAIDEMSGRVFAYIEEKDDQAGVYSRREFEQILSHAGFVKYECFYPVPDYRIMKELYSEDFPPKKGDITCISPSYREERQAYFNEVKAFDTVCEDGYIDEFANAFLYIASLQ